MCSAWKWTDRSNCLISENHAKTRRWCRNRLRPAKWGKVESERKKEKISRTASDALRISRRRRANTSTDYRSQRWHDGIVLSGCRQSSRSLESVEGESSTWKWSKIRIDTRRSTEQTQMPWLVRLPCLFKYSIDAGHWTVYTQYSTQRMFCVWLCVVGFRVSRGCCWCWCYALYTTRSLSLCRPFFFLLLSSSSRFVARAMCGSSLGSCRAGACSCCCLSYCLSSSSSSSSPPDPTRHGTQNLPLSLFPFSFLPSSRTSYNSKNIIRTAVFCPPFLVCLFVFFWAE